MIALVFCGDLKYCPYVQRYIERLELHGIQYKVLFWNRLGDDFDISDNYLFYDHRSELLQNKISKLMDFSGFRKWVIRMIEKLKLEKCILLSTLTGIMIGEYLISHSIRYLFDIRDYSYEQNLIFYAIEKKIIDRSAYTVISSQGFKAFLPQDKEYIVAHNFNRREIKSQYKVRITDEPINIVWNGMIRYFDFQAQYLNALKNDRRFMMVYYGDGPELNKYIDFCKLNAITNVQFMGRYNNNGKDRILSNASILNNCYGYIKDAGNKIKYAISNRFYDGLIYHIPQIVEPEGYKPQVVEQIGVGLRVAPEKDLGDKLFDYYHSINEDEFDMHCEKALKTILEEDDKYIATIDEFINC